MKISKRLLTMPLSSVPNKFVITILVLALIGFVDATYLTIEHYQNVIPPCAVGGCETVLTSVYSEVAGIPVALAGAIYYLFILIGALAYLEGRHERLLRYVLIATTFGLLASLYFLFLQAFILHAYCLYCLGSLTTSTVLFILAITVFSKYQHTDTLSV